MEKVKGEIKQQISRLEKHIEDDELAMAKYQDRIKDLEKEIKHKKELKEEYKQLLKVANKE